MSIRIEKEYVLLIMNCVRYRQKALLQKNTWLTMLPNNIQYYHVLGDTEMTDDFIFNNEENILWVKTKDDYNSLPHKVVSAYDAVHKTFNYKYIFKTDDDQQLKKPDFFATLTKLLSNEK